MPSSLPTIHVANHLGPWAARAGLLRGRIGLLRRDVLLLQEVLRGPGIELLDELCLGSPLAPFAVASA